jgi:hypothetical protein
MAHQPLETRLVDQETRALLTRLDRVRPFVVHETMVLAAAVPLPAQSAIENYLLRGRMVLRRKVHHFLRWLRGPAGADAPPNEIQHRFSFLRMQFNLVLSQFDIFADVMTQRSEHETGIWLAGLDVVAADALKTPGLAYDTPPVVCYLDRGLGAAIRRARTRLPGGGENPVGVVRVPRERMVGSGVASSLVHEVGHQGAAVLGLVESLRPVLQGLAQSPNDSGKNWLLWARWISEILADFWSVSRVGVAGPLGLMGVVSLPRPFVFRISLDDPHPIPWIRVKLGCAMGAALYPGPQWEVLSDLWERYYPLEGLLTEKQHFFRRLEAGIPDFIRVLVQHRPPALHGRSLGEVMALADRSPARLRERYADWRRRPTQMQAQMLAAPPTLVFAVLGQARADGVLGPEAESRMLADLLAGWAVRSTLAVEEICARQMEPRVPAQIT